MIDPELRSPANRTRTPWRDAPVLIMVIAGLFHFGRGAAVDGFIFVTIGGAVAAGELRGKVAVPRPGGGADRFPRWSALLAAAMCAGYGLVVGSWPLASLPVIVAIAVPGLLMLPVAWRAVLPASEPAGTGRWVWAAVMVLVCVWELISFLSQPDARTPSHDHPTLSVIMAPLFESEQVRGVLLAAWLGVGFWLFRTLTMGRDGGRR